MSPASRLVVLVSLVLPGTLAMATTAPTQIKACYNTATGNARIVSLTAACKTGEKAVEWNIKGPAGPQGVTGARGPAGPAGLKGTSGATGAQGPQGVQGAQGPKGDAGPAGNTGPQGPGGYSGVQLFAASGSWTAPSTIDHVVVELIGGGGAGGGDAAGGSGGSGAYTKAFITVTPGATYTVSIGQGGTGVASTTGGAGLTSSFEDNQSHVLAFALGGSGGGTLGVEGPGGLTTNNNALFASPGNLGAGGDGDPYKPNGISFVPNGTGYGAGGGAGGVGIPGQTGGSGALLIWW